MPKPSDVHISRALENILVANLQEQTDYVAGNVFPFVPCDYESGDYYIYDIADTARLEVKERAPSTESAGIDWIPTTDSFSCKEHMVHHDVDDRVANNADAGMEQRDSVGMLLTEQMLSFLDYLFAAEFFAVSKWTGSTTGSDIDPSTAWNNASGTPVSDVRAQASYMKRRTKKRPNCLVVSPDVHDALLTNVEVLSLLPSTSWQIPTNMDLAKAFDVQKYVVAGASYNAAAKGATTDMENIFGSEQALLCYSAPAPAKFAPSAGYCFVPRSYGGNKYGVKAWEYYISQIHSTRYEHGMLQAMKQVSSVLGCFFYDVLS